MAGALALFAAALIGGCSDVPATVVDNPALPRVELGGRLFHVREAGAAHLPVVVVVHDGPGGDAHYLHTLDRLSRHYRVVYYDQRGAGLSQRVDGAELTLATSLDDLHRLIEYASPGRSVRLLGHAWGAMLVVGYTAAHPGRVSHAVAVEPGMLTPEAAAAFVQAVKASQHWTDALRRVLPVLEATLTRDPDQYARMDHVMTRLLNQGDAPSPYQCPGESMPPDAFVRAGFTAFDAMLRPVLADPTRFDHDLTRGILQYRNPLMLVSSECSVIGERFQQVHHLGRLPPQTQHIVARGMGHNLLTLQPDWSVPLIDAFFQTPLPDQAP